MKFQVYRLTIDGHRSYPRTIEQATRMIAVARRLRPGIIATLSRVTQVLA